MCLSLNVQYLLLNLLCEYEYLCSVQMEYKYDGERAQVHLLGDEVGTVKIYSRNSEDNSEKYPDLRDVVLYVCLFLFYTLVFC